MNRAKRDGRLLMLHAFVRGGNTLIISKIAGIFHISTRTVYRDLERMRNALKEVEAEKKKLFIEELFDEQEN